MTTMRGGAVTRRGFLATVGAGAAAAAIPASAVAAALTTGGGAPLDALREWYRREIERLAEQLRPRFESGELRGHRDVDFRDDEGGLGLGWSADPLAVPFGRLEKLAGEHFGLIEEGSGRVGWAILAVAANVELVDGDHPFYAAREAAAWDVLALARSRGWYVATTDEEHQGLEVLS